jgi:hypothetical protein
LVQLGVALVFLFCLQAMLPSSRVSRRPSSDHMRRLTTLSTLCHDLLMFAGSRSHVGRKNAVPRIVPASRDNQGSGGSPRCFTQGEDLSLRPVARGNPPSIPTVSTRR